MKRIKVQVIDPSVVVRQIVISIVRKIDDIEITGSCSPEEESLLRKLEEATPDAIVMGLDPADQTRMDFFLQIRSRFPALPVIVLTCLSEQGAKAAITALRKGAVDFITIPPRTSGLTLARAHLEKRLRHVLSLIPRVNRNLLVKMAASEGEDPAVSAEQLPEEGVDELRNERRWNQIRSARAGVRKPASLVVIGGCTGAVPALFTLVGQLSPEIRVPVVVVQHMPRIYTKILADELNKVTPLRVREATFEGNLLPGEIYIAPGGFHVRLRSVGPHSHITPHRGLKEHESRPSIDVLLRSARHVHHSRILTVFLSGGGKDGILGAGEAIASGGKILLQDRKSSLLWDLADGIRERGHPARIVPADRLAEEIENLVELRFDQVQRDRERILETVRTPAPGAQPGDSAGGSGWRRFRV